MEAQKSKEQILKELFEKAYSKQSELRPHNVVKTK